MKKIEKYIYIVIAIILGAILLGVGIYIANSQGIKLGEEELRKYLSYVPRSLENKLYDKKETDLANVSEKLLITKILDNCSFDMNLKLPLKYEKELLYDVEYIDRYYLPLDLVKEKMEEYYNKEITNLEETKTLEDAYNTGMSFAYQNNYFLGLGGGETDDLLVSLLDNYEASKNQLIIYEYVAHYNYLEEQLEDYYNDYQVELSYETDFNKYLEENKDKFTLYKHTFKKNKTGYYWDRTEIVEK